MAPQGLRMGDNGVALARPFHWLFHSLPTGTSALPEGSESAHLLVPAPSPETWPPWLGGFC